MFKSCWIITANLILLVVAQASMAQVRVKDITSVEGVRSNQLYGLGLVVGLNGTGARQNSLATTQMAVDMLRKNDAVAKLVRQTLQDNVFFSNSISAVMVTAELSPFSRSGSRIDVTVSVIDTASSLEGGTLLLTPLKGADGEIYAVAQGAVSTGGFDLALLPAIDGTRNHPTVARIANGGIVEKEALGEMSRDGIVRLLLHQPDFSTAQSITQAINTRIPAMSARRQQLALSPSSRGQSSIQQAGLNSVLMQGADGSMPPPNTDGLFPKLSSNDGIDVAHTVDAGTVEVFLPTFYRRRVPEFINEIGKLEIEPDTPARVVINERTGTVIVGQYVTISAVAVAHGNLVIRPQIPEPPPQPGPAARSLLGLPPQPAAPQQAQTGPNAPPGESVSLLESSYTVAELARALNALGVSPRDVIAIFQALRESGALHAELVIM